MMLLLVSKYPVFKKGTDEYSKIDYQVRNMFITGY